MPVRYCELIPSISISINATLAIVNGSEFFVEFLIFNAVFNEYVVTTPKNRIDHLFNNNFSFGNTKYRYQCGWNVLIQTQTLSFIGRMKGNQKLFCHCLYAVRRLIRVLSSIIDCINILYEREVRRS